MHQRSLLFVGTFAFALFGGVRSGPLYKRFTGDGTFYDAGLGACGDTNSNADFICAMNAPQFDGSCNKQITIKGPKGSVTCTVKDKCPGCAFGSVDMTPAVFNSIADPSQGRVQISWNFGGSSPQPSPKPSPAPSPPPPQPTPPPANDRKAPSPPPPSSSPSPSVQDDEDDQDTKDVDDNNGSGDDESKTVPSVSIAFLKGDLTLINGGSLGNDCENPLDDPDQYINNVTTSIDSTDTGNTDPGDDPTGTSAPNGS